MLGMLTRLLGAWARDQDRSQVPLHAHTADGEHEEEGERRHAQQSEGDETEQSQQGRDHQEEERKQAEGGAIGDKDGPSSVHSEPAAGAEATPGAEEERAGSAEPEPEPEAAQPALEPTADPAAGELTSSSSS